MTSYIPLFLTGVSTRGCGFWTHSCANRGAVPHSSPVRPHVGVSGVQHDSLFLPARISTHKLCFFSAAPSQELPDNFIDILTRTATWAGYHLIMSTQLTVHTSLSVNILIHIMGTTKKQSVRRIPLWVQCTFFYEGECSLPYRLQGPLCPGVCLQVVFNSALQLIVNFHTISSMSAQQNPSSREDMMREYTMEKC